MTTKINGSWESVNQYIERNTVTGQCRLIGTTDIIPNLRYDSDNVGRNYAVTSFKEKRSTDNITTDTTTVYTPVRKVMIMLDDKLVEWDGKEYWKPIEWNDFYQVSTWGNVRNSKGNYISPCENRQGYLHLKLWKNGKSKAFRINRLVAEAFLPNPNNLSDVDHIDSKNKRNNMVDNLQWLSHADNVRKDQAMKVKRVTDLGDTIYYESMMEATRQTGFSQGNISLACNGQYSKQGHHYKDSEWHYVE